MTTRNGYIGNVPQQDSLTGNKGVFSVNDYSIEKRRDNIKTVNLPPTFSGKSLRFYYDASQVQSYAGSGNTWTDLSGSNYHATLYNPSYTSGDPSYFTLTSSFYINAGSILSSNLTMFWVMQTTDTQSLMVHDGNSDYLGAYRSGHKYYHSNVSGSRQIYVDGVGKSNLYDTIRDSTSQSVIISDCDFGWSTYKFSNYDGYKFDSNGKLYAMGAYTGNLTATDASNLHSFFSDLGYTGI